MEKDLGCGSISAVDSQPVLAEMQAQPAACEVVQYSKTVIQPVL